METTDRHFAKTFGIVVAGLLVMTVFILIIANLIGGEAQGDKVSQAQIDRANERIKPVGRLNLKSEQKEKAAQPLTTSVASADSKKSESPVGENTGKQVYDGLCHTCHASGLLNAPVFGDTEEWSKRLSKGREALYDAALHGLRAMPAKGGDPSLSDDRVKAAVDYMIKAAVK